MSLVKEQQCVQTPPDEAVAGQAPRVFPDLMTEAELLEYLRIPLVSDADGHNVIENLKRCRGLPRIHVCNKTLYPKKAVQDWIEEETVRGE